MNLIENAWKTHRLGDRRSNSGAVGSSISGYSVSSSWYNNIIDNSGTRFTRLSRYNDADVSSVEISRALDVIAEDITSCNADDQDLFFIEYDEEAKLKKTQMKVINAGMKVWMKRTGFGRNLFDRVRRTIKYGATFYEKMPDGGRRELPTERFIGYVLDENDENRVTHYIYDESIPRIDQQGRSKITNQGRTTSASGTTKRYIPADKLLILKVGEGIFGTSLIEKVYRVWRQMTLLEDAVIIYRIVRAPERRVYYIDVGNLQGAKRKQAIEQQRMSLMQKRSSRNNTIETEYDPHSTGEDIFIPTNSTGKGSRIETLPAGANLGEIGDVEWFSKKMAAGLRIPSSMIDSQSENTDQFSDARVGQLYQIEMRYLGHVKRMKIPMVYELNEDFRGFMLDRGVSIPEEANLKITESMSFAMYKDMELKQTALNIYNSTLQISSLSKEAALRNYLNMDEEEIIDNEVMKLREMGLDDEQIKDLPNHVVKNLVYGDGRLGSEYGIEADEQPKW